MQQFEQQLISNLQQIQPPDQNAMQLCRRRWDSIAKPLHSLGLLEDAIATIASAQGCPQVRLDKKCVAVFCADNGVVAQGVTSRSRMSPPSSPKTSAPGQTSVCAMARAAGAEVFPVDIGVAATVSGKGLRIHKIANGTADITQGPAMSREQAADAILYGMQMVGELKQQGYNLIATGEMGIGNTTTSSAILSVLLPSSHHRDDRQGSGTEQRRSAKEDRRHRPRHRGKPPGRQRPVGRFAQGRRL